MERHHAIQAPCFARHWCSPLNSICWVPFFVHPAVFQCAANPAFRETFCSYNVTTWSETHRIHTVALLYTSSWHYPFSSRTLALCNKIRDAFLSLLRNCFVLFSEIKPVRYNIYLLIQCQILLCGLFLAQQQ